MATAMTYEDNQSAYWPYSESGSTHKRNYDSIIVPSPSTCKTETFREDPDDEEDCTQDQGRKSRAIDLGRTLALRDIADLRGETLCD